MAMATTSSGRNGRPATRLTLTCCVSIPALGAPGGTLVDNCAIRTLALIGLIVTDTTDLLLRGVIKGLCDMLEIGDRSSVMLCKPDWIWLYTREALKDIESKDGFRLFFLEYTCSKAF
jgi:hypothetical protein